MKPFSFLTGLLLLSALPLELRAQDYPEFGIFKDAAEELSVLYRGRMSTKYHILANGNPYWSSPEYISGDILYEGRRYEGIELNIDALTQEPLVRVKGSAITVALHPDNVEWFTMGDTRFANLKLLGQDEMAAGFYEVLYEGGVAMYKRVDKRINSSVNPVNGSAIGYNDPYYRSDYYSYFEYMPTFYFRNAEGEMSKIRSRAAVIRQFPRNIRKDLRRYVSDKGLDSVSVSYESYCRALLEYADSL